MKSSKELYNRRRQRVRAKVKNNNSGRPRLTVYRSSKHIYVQIVDDKNGITVASASTIERDLRAKFKTGGNIEAAAHIGELVAQRATKAGIIEVVFDRSGYLYHGRVKAMADAAREGGLSF